MKQSRFSAEQSAYALRQADTGTPVGDVCCQVGVSEATFDLWKKKFARGEWPWISLGLGSPLIMGISSRSTGGSATSASTSISSSIC